MRVRETEMAARSTVSGVTSGVDDSGLEALPEGEPEAPAEEGDDAAVAAAVAAMPLALFASSAHHHVLMNCCRCCSRLPPMDIVAH